MVNDKEGKGVFVWGLGAAYKRRVQDIKNRYTIKGYIDNKLCKCHTAFEDKPLISSDEIDGDMTVLIMAQNFVPMVNELLAKGFEKVLIGIVEFPESLQEKLLAASGMFVFRTQMLYYAERDHEKEILIKEASDVTDIYRRLVGKALVKDINRLPELPSCRDFGISRGTPIDRVYIEQFLDSHKYDIRGDVAEIAENTYSLQFGEGKIKNSYVLHVNGWGENALKGNLETGEGLQTDMFDSAIITQTLMFIFDLKAAVSNIYKMLKPGGTALVTVSGISQISRYDEENWGSFWSFNQDAVKALFEPVFGKDNISVFSYGNVKTAAAFLYGICAEELEKSAFCDNDVQYPVIIGIRAVKEKI